MAVIGVIAYAGYRYYLPSMIAETLISDEPSSLVPAEMQEKVETVKRKIDKEFEKLPVFMKENKIAYEDLQVMIDRADPDQFIDAYVEIATTRITSTDQVFDIAFDEMNDDTANRNDDTHIVDQAQSFVDKYCRHGSCENRN